MRWVLPLLAIAGCAAEGVPKAADRWADRIVAFAPGPTAGFGQDKLPEVVLGPPQGAGDGAGSLHVLSMGKGGGITVAFDDRVASDGPGPDLVVFENAFVGFAETARVEASADGTHWSAWPCDPAGGVTATCAGLNPVWLAGEPTAGSASPKLWGGDAFDLSEIGLKTARYVRLTDTGDNQYLGITGGFDLDAVAAVHPAP
ncbi:MAG: cell surface protein [Deltaproteobacteria bacterium]|nr:cell surface protein [Deltaproteobacteria bacterium]